MDAASIMFPQLSFLEGRVGHLVGRAVGGGPWGGCGGLDHNPLVVVVVFADQAGLVVGVGGGSRLSRLPEADVVLEHEEDVEGHGEEAETQLGEVAHEARPVTCPKIMSLEKCTVSFFYLKTLVFGYVSAS